MSSRLLLSVKEAAVRYNGVPVFENLSFNIHEGSRIALVGKNGAGKSTLMNIITGFRDLDDGELGRARCYDRLSASGNRTATRPDRIRLYFHRNQGRGKRAS